MADRLSRCRRLLQTHAGAERLLREEIARGQRVCAQAERDIRALQAPPPAGAGTVAVRQHRSRYERVLARRREVLQVQWREAQREVALERGKLVQVAQTQRTLERLIARLEQAEEARRRRDEQQTADEHSQWRGPW